MGGTSEEGMAHIVSHRNSTVDVSTASGSEYFSLLGSGSYLWVVSMLVVRREGRRRCSVLATSYSEGEWRLIIGGADQLIGCLTNSLYISI